MASTHQHLPGSYRCREVTHAIQHGELSKLTWTDHPPLGLSLLVEMPNKAANILITRSVIPGLYDVFPQGLGMVPSAHDRDAQQETEKLIEHYYATFARKPTFDDIDIEEPGLFHKGKLREPVGLTLDHLEQLITDIRKLDCNRHPTAPASVAALPSAAGVQTPSIPSLPFAAFRQAIQQKTLATLPWMEGKLIIEMADRRTDIMVTADAAFHHFSMATAHDPATSPVTFAAQKALLRALHHDKDATVDVLKLEYTLFDLTKIKPNRAPLNDTGATRQ